MFYGFKIDEGQDFIHRFPTPNRKQQRAIRRISFHPFLSSFFRRSARSYSVIPVNASAFFNLIPHLPPLLLCNRRSGFIMPTYGDESSRGFYLRDGGYYFAMSDKWDLKLLGEIYTKGSWGVSAASNYRKRYKYSGSFFFSYQDTKTGDKGMPDFEEQKSFKVQWSHRQDTKANPFSTLSASVNFATSSYERNNLNSLYNPQTMTQSTRTSSVSWSTTFSSIGLTLSSTANLSQNMRDSSIAMTLPDLNISLSRFYPFRRKHAAGKERWYEKISMSYTGQLSNSISTKEDQLAHSNLIKDWRNGMQHSIPISGSFTLFDIINVNPSFNFTDRMYTNKIKRSWDEAAQKERVDTIYGFNNVYNWNLSLSASTKLYGFYVPNRKLFGDKNRRTLELLSRILIDNCCAVCSHHHRLDITPVFA